MCCFPVSNISVRKDFDQTNQSFHTFSGIFCAVYRVRTKCKQTYLTDNWDILGKVGGVYVTYVADVNKGLMWSCKEMCSENKKTSC